MKTTEAQRTQRGHRGGFLVVIPWLRKNGPTADLSLLDPASVDVYHDHLAEIFGGYAGQERRKWGVERRGSAS